MLIAKRQPLNVSGGVAGKLRITCNKWSAHFDVRQDHHHNANAPDENKVRQRHVDYYKFEQSISEECFKRESEHRSGSGYF